MVVVTTTLLLGAALATSDFTLFEICVSVGAASLPAVVDGATADGATADGAVVSAGAVAEIDGCAGTPIAAVAAAVSEDETLGVNSVAAGAVAAGAVLASDAAVVPVMAAAPAEPPASEAPLLTGGVLSITGADFSMTDGFEPWSLVRVLFFAFIVGTGSSTAGEAGVGFGAAAGTLGAGVGSVNGVAAGSAASAIGAGAD